MSYTQSKNIFRRFFALESAGGVLLIVAMIAAMLMKNSPLTGWYQEFLMMPIAVQVGALAINKPFLLWINDGFMAVFFMLIGLEIKQELLQGHLKTNAQRILPLIGAIGGVAVPAAFYLFINWDNQLSRHGWAIPTATDIAFALGILMLVAKNIPVSLKIFLMALAIFDDLMAIIIVAVFYTVELSITAIVLSWLGVFGLFILNRKNVKSIAAYILVGLFIWICVLKSGVHATLAGVITGLMIPLSLPKTVYSPAKALIHSLHPWVAFGILPLFAFANSGISFEGLNLSLLLDPIPFGIAIGLFFGKQVGIFGSAWLAIKLKIAKLPEGSNWMQLYGIAVLCGIGFTMSLFIGSLAFEYGGAGTARIDRLGIIVGSLASAILGAIILRWQANKS